MPSLSVFCHCACAHRHPKHAQSQELCYASQDNITDKESRARLVKMGLLKDAQLTQLRKLQSDIEDKAHADWAASAARK